MSRYTFQEYRDTGKLLSFFWIREGQCPQLAVSSTDRRNTLFLEQRKRC
jgi:hypothetical protein